MYTARKNSLGQIDIIKTATAHLPHVRVSWYPGFGLYCGGVCAVMPGETSAVAASRAFPESTHDKNRSVKPVDWVEVQS